MRCQSLVGRKSINLAILLAVVSANCGSFAATGQTKINLMVDDDISVRFSFNAPMSNYPRPALILRVASNGRQQMETAPLEVEGRSAYVSIEEMRALVRLLQDLKFEWLESKDHETVVPFRQLPVTDEMQITVFGSDGTAKAAIPGPKMCRVLAEANRRIVQPRAHWHFEFFRLMYGCSVQGFIPGKYLYH